MDRIPVEVTKELEDIVPGYLERLSGTIAKMESLVAAGNLPEVQKLSHNLKGSGGGYGFARISELGATIENASKAGDVAAAGQGIVELKDFALRVDVTFI